MMDGREVLRQIFYRTLASIDAGEAIRRQVRLTGRTLRAAGATYDLSQFRRVVVVAVGKAAGPMSSALVEALAGAVVAEVEIWGVVVAPVLPAVRDRRLVYVRGGHPLPTEGSFVAARAVLELLATAGADCLVIYLVSGGASALMELPLDERFGIEEVVDFHRALVHSGLAITEMNALRKHFSRVKGGRLALAAGAATQCTLLVSDVPPDRLDVVASGPSLPDPATVADCRAILTANPELLTERVRAYFQSDTLAETPKPGDAVFARAYWTGLLSSDDLGRAAGELATEAGFHTVIDNGCDEWEYGDAVGYLLDRLDKLRQRFQRVCVVSAGEVAVKLPAVHGRGGRNAQFALECARKIAGDRIAVLSCGSDGADGNSPSAGAVCDGTTWARAKALGLDPQRALDGFDAYPLLAALGDAVETGPTGNNLRDLRMLLHY